MGPMDPTTPSPPRFAVRVYSPVWRAVGTALWIAFALLSVALGVYLFVEFAWLSENHRFALTGWTKHLFNVVGIIAVVGIAFAWRSRAAVEVGDQTIAVIARRATWEIPRDAITGVSPWRFPLPRPGIHLAVRFGRSAVPGLGMLDPTPLVAALGGPADHPRLAYAQAARATRWLRHPLHALLLAPLVPTAIIFRVHQIITTGDWLGEYRWYGPGQWLTTLLHTWAGVAGGMLCWYAVWRFLVGALAWAAAELAPARARAARWILEITAFFAYYGGVAFALWTPFVG